MKGGFREMKIPLTRANLTAHVAARKNLLPVLSTICFTPEGTVSADGYRLLFVPYPEGKISLCDWVMIPAMQLAKITRALFSKNAIPEMSLNDGSEPLIEFGGYQVKLETVDGAFPKYQQIIPKDPPVHHKAFTLDLLIGALQQLRTTGAIHVVLDLYEKDSSQCIFRGVQGGAYAIMAPVHVSDGQLLAYVKPPVEQQQETAALAGAAS